MQNFNTVIIILVFWYFGVFIVLMIFVNYFELVLIFMWGRHLNDFYVYWLSDKLFYCENIIEMLIATDVFCMIRVVRKVQGLPVYLIR